MVGMAWPGAVLLRVSAALHKGFREPVYLYAVKLSVEVVQVAESEQVTPSQATSALRS